MTESPQEPEDEVAYYDPVEGRRRVLRGRADSKSDPHFVIVNRRSGTTRLPRGSILEISRPRPAPQDRTANA